MEDVLQYAHPQRLETHNSHSDAELRKYADEQYVHVELSEHN